MAEACRNLACSGAVPLGTTDNLNLPSPIKPELFWQIKESVRGLAEACRAFNAPVTGGNCSLYNQSPNGPIDPDADGRGGRPDRKTGTRHDAMVQGRRRRDHFARRSGGQSRSAARPRRFGVSASRFTARKPARRRVAIWKRAQTLHTTLLGLIQCGLVKSAHDCSEGGLAVCLAESCISQLIARETPRLIGAQIDLSALAGVRLDALLFGEAQSRVLISVAPGDTVKVLERARIMEVSATKLGLVGGPDLSIKTSSAEFKWPVTDLHSLWWNAIAQAMQ